MSDGKLTPNTMMSASRLPGLLGYSKYSTANDELKLTCDALDGVEPEWQANEPADWGNRFELQILQQGCERLGLDNFNLEHTEAHYHPDLPLCCSLDGSAEGEGRTIFTDPDAGIFVIGADGITLEGMGVLEAKLTSQDKEDVPALWRGPIQLQGQMMVTGAKWGAVFTLYRGTHMRVFLFERHPATIETITEAVKEFQRRADIYKETGVVEYYPPASSSDANTVWSEGIDREIELDHQCEIWAQEIADTKEEINELKAFIEDRETKIKASMQEATKAKAGRYKISWPMRHYKAQPERVVPAKEATVTRQSTLTIKEIK